jgi:RNA polymerase sigma-70 factor (ECF subfamily)
MSVFTPGVGRDEVRRNIAMAAAEQIAAVAETQDKVSYAALFRHFAPRVKAYLQLTGLPGEVAEELAQETMFRVWRNAQSFDANRGAAATWVYQIARNLRRDGIRREKHSLGLPAIVSDAEIYSADAERILSDRQDEIMIDEALRSLEPKLYEPIRLVYFEHLSQSQVAMRLGVPLGTVKSRLRVAVARLRQRLSRPTGPRCVVADDVRERGG